MYNDQLEAKAVSIDRIFLDPNNPRFWSEQTRNLPEVPERKISDPTNQSRTINRIADFGLEELRNSILRNGFLPLDRIVVREITGAEGDYVAIEGNRRLAALKNLRRQIEDGTVSEEGITEQYLQNLLTATNEIEVLVYRGEETKDIAWILQGIRHIGGIRDWLPAQQGKLVADQIDKEGLSLTEAGQRFGLTAQAVGRRYRSYKALEQMRGDDEFQARAENRYYSLFEEAVRQKDVRKWLGWDEEQHRFTDADNLKQFYAWICPDEEDEDKARRLHDPKHVQYLGRLLAAGQDELLHQIGNHELEIEAAYQRLKDVNFRHDWRNAFRKAGEFIDEIPNAAVSEDPQGMLDEVQKLEKKLSRIRTMAEAVNAENQI